MLTCFRCHRRAYPNGTPGERWCSACGTTSEPLTPDETAAMKSAVRMPKPRMPKGSER